MVWDVAFRRLIPVRLAGQSWDRAPSESGEEREGVNTNLADMPVGTTILKTNSDGSFTEITVVGRHTTTVDLRVWIPIVLGVVILVVWIIRSFRRGN